MTPFDVPLDEMGIDPEIANEELEALLAGHGRDKNLDLTRFVDDLCAAFPAEAPATIAHLAAIAYEAHLLADKGDPVERPASNAVAPALRVSRPPKRRRNTMKDRKARILIKIAAPIVALFAVLGIMGSAGALPRTLQHLTSHAAGIVGLTLPTGDDDGTDTTTDDQGDENDQGTDVKDATDQGDQNDQGDSTGSSDSTDQGDQNDQGDSTSSDSTDQGDQNDQGDSTGSSDSTDQDDQNDQGDSSGSSDQGDQNDQGDSTGGSSGGSSENDQGDGGSSQDNQGDSSGDGGSGSSDSGSGSSGSGSGDNQD